MAEEMQCEVEGCSFKTQPLKPEIAMQRLTLHDRQVHGGAPVITHQQIQESQAKVKPDKVRRPELKKGISEDKYLHYHRQWVRYKRATGLVDEDANQRPIIIELFRRTSRRYGEFVWRAVRHEDRVRATL